MTHYKNGGSGAAVTGGKRTDKISPPSLTLLAFLGETSLGGLFCPFSFPLSLQRTRTAILLVCVRKQDRPRGSWAVLLQKRKESQRGPSPSLLLLSFNCQRGQWADLLQKTVRIEVDFNLCDAPDKGAPEKSPIEQMCSKKISRDGCRKLLVRCSPNVLRPNTEGEKQRLTQTAIPQANWKIWRVSNNSK